MFFTSYPELYATLAKLEPTLKARLEAKGFILLSWGHGGWVYFFTKAPVETVEGLRRTKMFTWAGDDQMVSVWKAKGFNPIPLAATDIMTGLQTGMIDSYPSTPLLGLTLQWYRQTPNMVGMGMAPLVGGLVITKTAWLKMPAADRALVKAACARMEKKLEVEVPRQDTTAVTEMQKRGLKVNVDAQVVNHDGGLMPGLYAAGETVGIYYGKYPGATSVMRGAVFGRIAGQHAAVFARGL